MTNPTITIVNCDTGETIVREMTDKEYADLLNEQKKFLELQTNKSNRIKDEISRDTSKQVMAQKDLKKYM